MCGGMLFPFAEAQVVQRGMVLEMNSGNRPLAGGGNQGDRCGSVRQRPGGAVRLVICIFSAGRPVAAGRGI